MARVALYGAGGAPFHHAAVFASAGASVDFVFPADIAAGALAAYDVFVMPGGGYFAMQGQLEPLGAAGCRAIREYVETGGMYVGSCAGSYSAVHVPASFLRTCPVQAELRLLDWQIWNGWDSPLASGLQSPGIGTLRATNAVPAHPVMAGMPASFTITHYNGPLFAGGFGLPGGGSGVAGAGRGAGRSRRHGAGSALAAVAGTEDDFTPAEEFLGSGTASDTVISRGVAAGVANVVAGRRGSGRVVLFGSHPEFGSSVAMDDLPAAAQMLVNALNWQLSETAGLDRPVASIASRGRVGAASADADLRRLDGLVDRIATRCAELASRWPGPDGPAPAWLDEKAAMSVFGLSPGVIWTAALRRIPELAQEALAAAPSVGPDLLSFRAPASWQLDGGFHGVAPLLDQVDELLAGAAADWDFVPSAGASPYADIFCSPYHLVAGSYLAAIGRAAGAALLGRAALARSQ